MKNIHSVLRAEERYGIIDFNPSLAINEILEDHCILLKSDFERFSLTFLIKYFNKYIRVVTDYNLQFVKTVLPFQNNLNAINQLIQN